MALAWPFKDPDEVLDYRIDWTARLDTDSIVASTWVISGTDAALDEDSNLFSADLTTIWLSGGTVGVKYLLTNHITTAGGRQMDQTVALKVKVK